MNRVATHVRAASPIGAAGRWASVLAVCWVLTLPVAGFAQDPSGLVGRWDLTVQASDATYPSWLEIRRSGYDTLVGSFVGRFGSARPIAKVIVEDAEFRFTIPRQWESRTEDLEFRGTWEGDVMRGETVDEAGKPATWSGVRAPDLVRDGDEPWGEPIVLFDGKSLEGWHARHPDRPNGWEVQDGILTNARPGNDLMTDRTFEDFRLHVEFRYPAGSNSGIYLRGRHEVQIEDNYGEVADSHRIGGVYGFLTPSVNAAKPAGEWQTMDIELQGRVVSVYLNGQRVIDRQTIPGITGGAIDSEEGAPGPLLIQGDHGPVEFRTVVLTPTRSSPPLPTR